MTEITINEILLTGRDADRLLQEAKRRNMNQRAVAEQLLSEMLTYYYGDL